MILCLDVGNSQIHGGVFNEKSEIMIQFRQSSKLGSSSDEYGLFLRSVLRENDIDPDKIAHISICTVVPEALHSIKNCCLKYFKKNPFVLQAGVKTGLQIKYRSPVEVGTDRIANAIAAKHLYPNENLIVIDFGTATTLCAISSQQEYLGGAILPGLKISMESLESRTSKLPSVEIVTPNNSVGRSTVESIQSGLFYGNLGAIKEIKKQMEKEAFNNQPAKVIGTGGFSSLFEKAYKENLIDEPLFNEEVNDLVLKGLFLAFKLNT